MTGSQSGLCILGFVGARFRFQGLADYQGGLHGVIVKIMVPFWITIIIRHLIFRVPKKEPEF